MKGQRTNQSPAPTSFMISISVRRMYTAVLIVFMMITRLITARTTERTLPTHTVTVITLWSRGMTPGL